MMMTTPHMNKYPAIGFEFGNDVATVHALIIHIIHTSSILQTASQRSAFRMTLPGTSTPLRGGVFLV